MIRVDDALIRRAYEGSHGTCSDREWEEVREEFFTRPDRTEFDEIVGTLHGVIPEVERRVLTNAIAVAEARGCRCGAVESLRVMLSRVWEVGSA